MTQLLLFNVFNGLIVGRVLRAHGAGPVADPEPERRHQLRARRLPRAGRLPRLHAHAARGLLGRAGDRALPHGRHRARRRAVPHPAALRARSALQPAAHLRPRLRLRGRARATSGARRALPFPIPASLTTPLSPRVLLPHRLPALHGGAWWRWRWPASSCILNRTRLGMRIRAGTLDLETVSVLGVNVRDPAQPELRPGHLPRRARRRARRRACSGLQPTIGTSLIMPSFVAIIVGGLGSLPGHAAGRPADRRRPPGITTVFFPRPPRR